MKAKPNINPLGSISYQPIRLVEISSLVFCCFMVERRYDFIQKEKFCF